MGAISTVRYCSHCSLIHRAFSAPIWFVEAHHSKKSPALEGAGQLHVANNVHVDEWTRHDATPAGRHRLRGPDELIGADVRPNWRERGT
jgi:hypothetical protein